MDIDDYMAYASIRQWYQSSDENARSGSISQNVWEKKLYKFRLFHDFCRDVLDIDQTPDELLASADEDISQTKQILNDWFKFLKGNEIEGERWQYKSGKERHISHNSARVYLAVVRGFFSHNYISFGKWRIPDSKVSATSRTDDENPIFQYDDKNGERYVDTRLLQEFMAHLNFRDQTIMLALYSTGLDAGDLLAKNLGLLRRQNEKKRIYLTGNRAKTQLEYRVYFTKEATEMVRRYVAKERQDAGDGEPIWVKREYGEGNGSQRMTTYQLGRNFNAAAEAIGKTQPGQPNPFRPKRFRHLFRAACTEAGIPPATTKLFMGHSRNSNEGYVPGDPGWLLQSYVKVEPFLTVMKTSEQENINSIRADLESAQRERDELQKTVAELRQDIQMIAEIIDDEEALTDLLSKDEE